jgi:hypothetical protein
VSPILRDIGFVIEAPTSKFIHKGEVLSIVRLHLFDDSVNRLTIDVLLPIAFHGGTRDSWSDFNVCGYSTVNAETVDLY